MHSKPVYPTIWWPIDTAAKTQLNKNGNDQISYNSKHNFLLYRSKRHKRSLNTTKPSNWLFLLINAGSDCMKLDKDTVIFLILYKTKPLNENKSRLMTNSRTYRILLAELLLDCSLFCSTYISGCFLLYILSNCWPRTLANVTWMPFYAVSECIALHMELIRVGNDNNKDRERAVPFSNVHF